MKVAHIITGLEDGGAEAVLFRLSAYDKSVHHHVISLMGPGKYGPLLEELGVSVSTLEMKRGRPSPAAVWRLAKIIRRVNPDIVQTWMYHANLIGGLAARLVGIGDVFWGIRHADLNPGTTSRSTRLAATISAKVSAWLPQRIVYCAERARVTHEEIGFPTRKGVVVPNGYDLSIFSPSVPAGQDLRQKLHIEADVPLIGMVARWHPDKNHKLLFHALAELNRRDHKFRCLLVGSGMDSSNVELIGLLDDLQLSDVCLLLSKRGDVNAVMNALDIHVLSSSSEGFPNVVAEAMASGTPCVSTDVGDASSIVGDTGWIVPPEDSPALVEAIVEALREIGTCQFAVRRDNARKRIAARFSIRAMIDSYHSVWFDHERST